MHYFVRQRQPVNAQFFFTWRIWCLWAFCCDIHWCVQLRCTFVLLFVYSII